MHTHYNYFRSIIFTLLLNIFAINACEFTILPENEIDGEQWIKEGLIDEQFWSKIREYYTEPISIASGELSELSILFNSFDCNLPSDKVIKNYLPWNSKSKEAFLKKYDFLLPIIPILSFNPKDISRNSRVIASTSRPKNSHGKSINSNIKFINRPTDWINFSGNIKFFEGKFRWYSRNILYKSKLLSLSIGNFRSPLDNGLFFGNFNKYEDSYNIIDNWLYTDRSNWNGAKLKITKNSTDVSMSLHKRFDEIVGIFKYNLNISKFINLATVIGISESKDPLASLSSRLSIFKNKNELAVTISGSNNDYTKIPIIVLFDTEANNRNFTISLTLLPKGFYAPKSLTLSDAMHRLNIDSNSELNIFLVNNRYSEKRIPNLQIISNISYIFTNSPNNNLSNHWNLRAKIGGVYKKKYLFAGTYRVESSDIITNKHNIFLKAEFPVNSIIKFIPYHQLYIKSRDYYRLSSNFKLVIFTPRIIITPNVKFYANNKNYHYVSFGLTQKIILHDKTYGEYRFDISPHQPADERINFFATLSFYF